ncbi:unnamed protein product [Adineta steineri]|uniref:VWFA domain-containing protein n=1 Tax=Adineta steineri TaxID=433720 RepID=A0A814S562_9BILA|nr:unnamed protein product [Adineta steineri]CAF1142793.1 unnamed protein product [Adineta steineri]
MTLQTNKNDLICYLCGNIYTNPIFLSPCGHSFDRECILQHQTCPIERCNAYVYETSLIPNHTIKSLVDRHYQLTQCIYEIFLLDTSTSMWYSDFYIKYIGKSRFQAAIEFLTKIFEQRWNSTTNQISLVTFDTNPYERFSFEMIREHHIKILQKLQPDGAYTALFDAIKFCLKKFENLNQKINRSTTQCLYILTDGGDNFSASGNQQHYIHYVKEQSQKLNISGHIIQIGDKNLTNTKDVCDKIDYHFHHFNNGNAPEFTKSFLLSPDHYTQTLQQTIDALPMAHTEPIQSNVIGNKIAVYE